uniref:Uncharacterized protein n=1 Tax=Arundo donax TaxID=35708 RepID=A0A0A9C0M6_ARUDO
MSTRCQSKIKLRVPPKLSTPSVLLLSPKLSNANFEF